MQTCEKLQNMLTVADSKIGSHKFNTMTCRNDFRKWEKKRGKENAGREKGRRERAMGGKNDTCFSKIKFLSA